MVKADPTGKRLGTDATGEHCAEVYTETIITGLFPQVYPAVPEDAHAVLSEQMHELAALTVNDVQALLTRGASLRAVT